LLNGFRAEITFVGPEVDDNTWIQSKTYTFGFRGQETSRFDPLLFPNWQSFCAIFELFLGVKSLMKMERSKGLIPFQTKMEFPFWSSTLLVLNWDLL